MVQLSKQQVVAHEGETALSAHGIRFKSGRLLSASSRIGGLRLDRRNSGSNPGACEERDVPYGMSFFVEVNDE